MKAPKKNPGELTTAERLVEAIRERDEASASCMALIKTTESLIKLLHELTQFDRTQHTIAEAWECIRKARRGK